MFIDKHIEKGAKRHLRIVEEKGKRAAFRSDAGI